MGSVWMQNLIGLKKDEESIRKIPYPLLELHIHVTEKTVQVGSLLGGWIVPVIVQALTMDKSCDSFKSKIANYGRTGMLIGLPLGPLMTYSTLKSKHADIDSIYDRTYRLRHNQGQLNVDRASIVGGALGYFISGGWFGVVNGVNVGIVLSAIYNNVIKSKKVDEIF